jgi:hypothetical protein
METSADLEFPGDHQAYMRTRKSQYLSDLSEVNCGNAAGNRLQSLDWALAAHPAESGVSTGASSKGLSRAQGGMRGAEAVAILS